MANYNAFADQMIETGRCTWEDLEDWGIVSDAADENCASELGGRDYDDAESRIREATGKRVGTSDVGLYLYAA